MIYIKNKEEIGYMKQGGSILSHVLSEVLKNARPGVSELELDSMAEELIRKSGGEPGFKKVKGYHHTICVSVNDIVVHGIPTRYKLMEGDVLGIDCGVFYKGFHTDMAETIQVRSSKFGSSGVRRFLETGKRALLAGINQAKAGNRVGHISKAIQDVVERESGYSVVRSLIGHGVGKKLHEDPEVPGFVTGQIEKTPVLKEGMTIAVEVIYNMGKPDVVLSDDRWTIKTEDGSLSGLFERSIVITKNGYDFLTPNLVLY